MERHGVKVASRNAASERNFSRKRALRASAKIKRVAVPGTATLGVLPRQSPIRRGA